MSPLEKEFIRACQAEQKHERRAVQLRWAGTLGAIVFALIIGGLALTGQLNRFIYHPLPMEWVTVPEGEFMMGSEDGGVEEKPIHTVFLDAFEIGMYEVTNEQYYQCARADVCSLPRNKNYGVEKYLDHPVVNVNWFDANTFCQWSDPNGRLPTEAEWEKAARGIDGRTYPWGEGVDCSLANYYGRDNGSDFCLGDTTPIGSYDGGVSPYGAYDMAGNVMEWVADWYDESYYASLPTANPLGPDDGDLKGLRGGAWRHFDNFLRSTIRFGYNPADTSVTIGFRCARSISP